MYCLSIEVENCFLLTLDPYLIFIHFFNHNLDLDLLNSIVKALSSCLRFRIAGKLVHMRTGYRVCMHFGKGFETRVSVSVDGPDKMSPLVNEEGDVSPRI